MGLLLACLALFGSGVAGSCSPCVLPLVPGYLGVMADSARRDSGVTPPHPPLLRIVVFVAAAVATFAVLGSVVAAAGGSLSVGAAVGQRLAGGGLIVLSILSVVANRGWWAPTWRPLATLPGRPVARAAMLGVGCGAAWSPCVGPLLGAALTAAGGTGSAARGALLLASFGLGITSPFVLLATLPRPRPPQWARSVGRIAATAMPAVLLAFGVVLVAGWYDAVVRGLPFSAG